METALIILVGLGLALRLTFSLVLLVRELPELTIVPTSELFTGGGLLLIALAYLLARHPRAATAWSPVLAAYLVMLSATFILFTVAFTSRAARGQLTLDTTLTDLLGILALLALAPLFIWGGCMAAWILDPDPRTAPPDSVADVVRVVTDVPRAVAEVPRTFADDIRRTFAEDSRIFLVAGAALVVALVRACTEFNATGP